MAQLKVGTENNEVSGRRATAAIPGSKVAVIQGGPHGFNLSHADEFNRALLDFLA